MRVHNTKHDHGVGGLPIKHGIGKPPQQRAASLALYLWVHLGRPAQTCHRCAYCPNELETEAGALLLVSVECVYHLAPRDWTKLDTALGP